MIYGYVCADPPAGNVYFLRNGCGAIKIGIATDVNKRMDTIQAYNPNQLEIFCILKLPNMDEAYKVEQSLHRLFHVDRIHHEWFSEKNILNWLRKGNMEISGYTFNNIDW